MFQPISILNTYNDIVQIKVNRFKDGYTRLLWLRETDGAEFYSDLKDPNCKIAGFTEGAYQFCTMNTQTDMTSNLISVWISQKTIKQQVQNLWDYAEVESDDYNNRLKTMLITLAEQQPERNLLQLLFMLYDPISDKQLFETDLFYKLILIQEKLENQYLGNLNRSGGFIKLKIQAQSLLEITDDIDLIRIYNQDKELIRTYRPTGTSQQLILPDYGLYDIHVISGIDTVAVLRHCQLSTDYIADVWSKNQEQLETYLNAVEDDYNLSSNSETFTEVEKTDYLEELSFTPRNAVFPRIQVLESDVSRAVDLSVSGIQFAAASNHTFYVSGCDADYLQDTVQNEFFLLTDAKGTEVYSESSVKEDLPVDDMEADTVSIQQTMSTTQDSITDIYRTRFEPVRNMIDTEALLYIVDENNKIVSRITRCLFDEDWTTTLVDYHEKIRVLEVSDYMRGLAAHVLETYSDANNYVKDLAASCLEDTTVNIDNILEYLLKKIKEAPYKINQDKLSLEVLKYWFTDKDYNSDFFSTGGFTWSPYTYKLTTEESEDGYVLCILAEENGAESFERHYLHSREAEALQVLLNRFGRYVVYAVSETDYRYSGFLYLNHNTRYVKSYLLNLKVR